MLEQPTQQARKCQQTERATGDEHTDLRQTLETDLQARGIAHQARDRVIHPENQQDERPADARQDHRADRDRRADEQIGEAHAAGGRGQAHDRQRDQRPEHEQQPACRRPTIDLATHDPDAGQHEPHEHRQRLGLVLVEQPVHQSCQQHDAGGDSDAQRHQEAQVDVMRELEQAAGAQKPQRTGVEAADRHHQALVVTQDQRDCSPGDARHDVGRAHGKAAQPIQEIGTHRGNRRSRSWRSGSRVALPPPAKQDPGAGRRHPHHHRHSLGKPRRARAPRAE